MTGRRVVVTGIGLLVGHGKDKDVVFQALMRGETAIERILIKSRVGEFETVGAAVRDEQWNVISPSQRIASDRVSLYALVAADSAIRDADLRLSDEALTRIGVSVGTSLGGAISQETAYTEIISGTKTRVSPFTLVKVMYNGPAAQLCLKYGIRGPSLTYSTTCSSSAVAVGESMRQIRHGYADVMIAGGCEALFAYVSIKAWEALHVLAPIRQEDVGSSCRPFSIDRSGTVLGDGAVFLVLEELEHAKLRGARIYAEISGYGLCNDPNHMTQPSCDDQARAMVLALEDANLEPSSIDYINAHGTGTKLNDVAETSAIKSVFGLHSRNLPVSSTKSMHGHLVGASGALELAICALAIQNQAVPPTAHLDSPDPECDLDYVPHIGRAVKIRTTMSNSFAVGGTASVLILTR